MNAELQQLTSELNQKRSTISSLNSENSSLKQQVANLQNELDSLRNQGDQSELKIRNLNIELDESEAVRKELKEDIEGLNDRII